MRRTLTTRYRSGILDSETQERRVAIWHHDLFRQSRHGDVPRPPREHVRNNLLRPKLAH